MNVQRHSGQFRSIHNHGSVQVDESLKVCSLQLESIATRLVEKYTSKFSEEITTKWAGTILDLSHDTSKLIKELEIHNAEIAELTSVVDDTGSNSDQNSDSISAKTKQSINKKIDKYRTKDSNLVKKITGMLHPNDEDDDDVDLRVITGSDQEGDFKCPFSQMIYVKPMKSKNCIHHLSYESLQALLNNGRKPSVICPVVGCKKMWSIMTSTEDKEFEFRMDRFLRMQSSKLTQPQLSSQALDVEDVDIDNDIKYTVL